MTKLWAKMVDTDGDGNLEVVQTHDEDPSGLWHPDFLSAWQEVPSTVSIGYVLEKDTGVWWSGSDWLERKIENSPAPLDPDVVGDTGPIFKGAVTKVKIVSQGDNYDVGYVMRNQYDVGNGTHLVLSATFDEYGEKLESVTIENHGQGYEVGQQIQIKEGFSPRWDKRNPTYAIIEIEEVKDGPDAVIPEV